MFTVALQLQPGEALASWDPQGMRLRLTAPSAPPAGEKAAIQIGVAGSEVAAKVVGTVKRVTRIGVRYGLELVPDAESMRAVKLVLAAARGERVDFSRRPARYLVRLPATVTLRDSSRFVMTTESVSEGGCGLSWSGRPPDVGQVLRVRLDATPRAAENQGAVCWTAPSATSALAGVQFAGSRAPPAWAALVAALARSGAPRA